MAAWGLPPVYLMAQALIAGSFAGFAVVVVEPPPELSGVVVLAELEHAAATSANATSAIGTLFFPVLMGLLVVVSGGSLSERRCTGNPKLPVSG